MKHYLGQITLARWSSSCLLLLMAFLTATSFAAVSKKTSTKRKAKAKTEIPKAKAPKAKAAKAARAAALHGETVASITRGDDRPYPEGAVTTGGAAPRLESVTQAPQPPMPGLTPAG